jgi:hypothetical protein
MGGALYWEKIRGIYSMEKVPWEVSHLVHTICTQNYQQPKERQTVRERERERERERLNSTRWLLVCLCHGRQQGNTFDIILASFHQVVKSLDFKKALTCKVSEEGEWFHSIHIPHSSCFKNLIANEECKIVLYKKEMK